MIVFKTYFKILKKNIFVVILYTVFLLFFAGFNVTTSDETIQYVDSKPDIFIVNQDEEIGIVKNLLDYFKTNCNILDIQESKIDDALFYRDVSFIIYIPKNFRNDFLSGLNPTIKVQSTGDYDASLANLYLKEYMQTATFYRDNHLLEEDIISNLNKSFQDNIHVTITSKLNTTSLNKASFYYTFLNYSLLATCVYVITLIVSSFREDSVQKRIMVSSMEPKRLNRYLLLANFLFAFTIWLLYVILSFLLVGGGMASLHGLVLIINSFLFMILSLTVSLLITNLKVKKEAINGIVNVLSLGTSFLCGAFVPREYLPDIVLKIAHIFPNYYYIYTNDLIKNMDLINIHTLKPVMVNMLVIILFVLFFLVINNYISKKN